MRGAGVLATPVGFFLIASAAALPLGGCTISTTAAGSSTMNDADPAKVDVLGNLTYRAIDKLVAALPELAMGKAVVVGSIVDVQEVDKSLPFGNLVADLARSRLVQKGVIVSEMRLRSAVMFDEKQGSITLANDRSALVPPPNAVAILTGTYAASDEMIYVSLKLITVSDARIVGAVDFAMPRTGSETLLAPPPT
jgi:hypothetical protein